MKIAVTYKDGEIFQHFGHCESFKIYEVENNEIKSTDIINADGEGHSALSILLKDNNVDALICGGMGGCAKNALTQAGIKFYPGVNGDADSAVTALLNGNLDYNPDTVCAHHHGEHSCGNHEHSCNHHH